MKIQFKNMFTQNLTLIYLKFANCWTGVLDPQIGRLPADSGTGHFHRRQPVRGAAPGRFGHVDVAHPQRPAGWCRSLRMSSVQRAENQPTFHSAHHQWVICIFKTIFSKILHSRVCGLNAECYGFVSFGCPWDDPQLCYLVRAKRMSRSVRNEKNLIKQTEPSLGALRFSSFCCQAPAPIESDSKDVW